MGVTEAGTALEVELWVDPTAADLAPFESYRQLVGAPPVSYVRVLARNEGTAPDSARFLTFTGDDGDLLGPAAVEANFVCAMVGTEWVPPTDADASVVDAYASLYGGPCGSQLGGAAVAAGASMTYYLAVEGEPSTFERVFAGSGNELEPTG